MSRILPITQFAAVVSLWLAGLSALAVTCLSIAAMLVVAIGTIGVWIWQDQRKAAIPGANDRIGTRCIGAPDAADLGIAS